MALVARAIRSGVFNDLGSGSNVDVAVITKDKTEMMRNYETPVSYNHPTSTSVRADTDSNRTSEVSNPATTSSDEVRQLGQRRRSAAWSPARRSDTPRVPARSRVKTSTLQHQERRWMWTARLAECA